MSKSRAKKNNNNNLLTIPRPEGFFTDMPRELIQEIGQLSDLNDAAILMLVNKHLYASLHQVTTKRFLQSQAVANIVNIGSNTFCILQNGDVLARGENKYGELGFGDTERRGRLKVNPSLLNVEQIVNFGSRSILFITQTGEAYVSGNFSFPSGYFHYPYPSLMIEPSTNPQWFGFDKKIIKAMDDQVSTCLLTDVGEVYVLGSDGWGELGLGEDARLVERLTLIRDIPMMRDLVYTGHELYLLTLDHLLYACGDNDYGQLGLGSRVNTSPPVRVPYIDNVKSVTSFSSCVYALTHQGQVYAWGNNDDGVLGFGDKNAHNSPGPLTSLNNIVLMNIGRNRFFVTEEGAVYVFGRNQNGELGLGHRNPQMTPILHPTLRGIKNIFCQKQAVFFTTTENDIYVTGSIYRDDEFIYFLEPQLISDNPIHDTIEQVERISDSKLIWRTHDGVTYISDQGWVGDGDHMAREPRVVINAPFVNEIIDGASVADLLFYSQGVGGYAKYCYQRALEKIEEAITPAQLVHMLQELNVSAWNNCDEIKTILPAYHLILRYVNDPANHGHAWSVINAWTQLLLAYRNLADPVIGDLSLLRDFLDMLSNPAMQQPRFTFFQPPLLARRANRELLAQIQADPIGIRIAAEFLAAELPPCPPSELKRAANDEVEGEHQSKKPRK